VSPPNEKDPDAFLADRTIDDDAEQSVLGSMLLSPAEIADVQAILRRGDRDLWSDPRHERLYGMLLDMADLQKPIDLVTVRDELQRLGWLNDDDLGLNYVLRLVDSVSDTSHAPYYASIVRKKATLRQLASACRTVQTALRESQAEPDDLLETAQRTLMPIFDRRETQTSGTSIGDLAAEVFAALEFQEKGEVTGMPTGFRQLDQMLTGLHGGELIIVAGRPSMGKTALATEIALHVACKLGKPVGLFSMEMGRYSVTARIMCSIATVPGQAYRTGFLSKAEVQRLKRSVDDLKAAPLFIDDMSPMNLWDLKARVRQMRRRQNIEVVIIDYLQLVCSGRRVESRQVEVAEISREIKGLARELDLPVLVMAQLNRQPEGRPDKRPMLSDLRESGALEQDADVVLLLHRKEYYTIQSGVLPKDVPIEEQGVAELIVAKQRNGPVGTVRLRFDHDCVRFDNLASEADVAYQQYCQVEVRIPYADRDPQEPDKPQEPETPQQPETPQDEQLPF
jgi:replicative DNA helicase